MRKWLFCILGVLLIQATLAQGNLIWPESPSDLITDGNATIGIQVSASITLQGYESIPLNTDIYIGLFYNIDSKKSNFC